MIADQNCPVSGDRLPIGRLRSLCMQHGCDFGELARRAGVSRTTLYHLDRGRIQRPHPSTLGRIAAALQVSPQELWEPVDPRSRDARPCSAPPQRAHEDAGAFDRATNPAVAEVHRERPDLFRGWSPEQWSELYSTFGTGGHLTPEGVAESAGKINRKREVVRKLHVVLETHLSEVAATMIATLYEMVRVGASATAVPHAAHSAAKDEETHPAGSLESAAESAPSSSPVRHPHSAGPP